MTTRLVVSDTSPIRVLHHLAQLHLLGEYQAELLIDEGWDGSSPGDLAGQVCR